MSFLRKYQIETLTKTLIKHTQQQPSIKPSKNTSSFVKKNQQLSPSKREKKTLFCLQKRHLNAKFPKQKNKKCPPNSSPTKIEKLFSPATFHPFRTKELTKNYSQLVRARAFSNEQTPFYHLLLCRTLQISFHALAPANRVQYQNVSRQSHHYTEK